MLQVLDQSVRSLHPPDTRPVVCHVIHSLGVGGAEVLVDQMVRRMQNDYRAIVAVLDDVGEIGRRLRRDGYFVEHLQRAAGIDWRCARRLHGLIKREGVSVLHAHQHTPFFQAMLSRGLTGQTPVIFTEHGRHFPDAPSLRRSFVNRLLLRRQDRLVGCGAAVRQALIDNERLPEHRVEVVYNGVDLDAVARAPVVSRSSVRREFGLTENDVLVAQVARLHQLKDHATALRAIDRARQTFPRIRLLIAGDGEERDSIRSLIGELGLRSHVIPAGTRKDVSRLLAASDVFLLTSLSEGIPLTVIEAMAARLPVVATRVGGLPEMIDEGLTGFLCPVGDDAALAGRLVELAGSRLRRRAMGSRAQLMAARRFSLDAMLKSYRRLYEDVLVGSAAHPRNKSE